MRTRALGVLVVLLVGSAARADFEVGPFLLQDRATQVTRVNGADVNERVRTFTLQASQAGVVAQRDVTIAAIWVRTGAIRSGTIVGLSLSIQGNPVPIDLGTHPLTANAWNRLALTPAVLLQNGVRSYVSFTSPPTTDFDLLGLDGQTWSYTVREDQSGYGRRIQGPSVFGATLVLEYSERGDGLAPSTCDAGQLPQVTGNPYTEFRWVRLEPGQVIEQRVLARYRNTQFDSSPMGQPPRTFAPWQVLIRRDSGQEAEVTMVWPDAGETPAVVTRASLEAVQVQATCNYGVPYDAQLNANPLRIRIRAKDAPVEVGVLFTEVDAEGECGPLARASWGGSLGGSGLCDGGHCDVYLRSMVYASWTQHRDVDGDGAGDPSKKIFAEFCPGYVRDDDRDCDDTNPAISPNAKESCNAIDDDCDGLVDAVDPTLVIQACALDAGVCRNASPTAALCVDGGWKACGHAQYAPTFEPIESSCDGLDNDCDGVVDDTVDGPLCTLQAGVCAGRRASRCVAGMWATCTLSDLGPLYEPSETACDGLDNDCNGQVDDFVALPLCSSQQGVCAGQRITSCTNGAPGACAATGYEATEQSCDGKDNDCDGKVDEGCVSMPPLGTEEGMPAKSGCATVAGAPLVLLALAWRRRR